MLHSTGSFQAGLGCTCTRTDIKEITVMIPLSWIPSLRFYNSCYKDTMDLLPWIYQRRKVSESQEFATSLLFRKKSEDN